MDGDGEVRGRYGSGVRQKRGKLTFIASAVYRTVIYYPRALIRLKHLTHGMAWRLYMLVQLLISRALSKKSNLGIVSVTAL